MHLFHTILIRKLINLFINKSFTTKRPQKPQKIISGGSQIVSFSTSLGRKYKQILNLTYDHWALQILYYKCKYLVQYILSFHNIVHILVYISFLSFHIQDNRFSLQLPLTFEEIWLNFKIQAFSLKWAYRVYCSRFIPFTHRLSTFIIF